VRAALPRGVGVGSELLGAVLRCNEYEPADFVPVLVGDEQVGWLNSITLEALAPQLAVGRACELVDLCVFGPDLASRDPMSADEQMNCGSAVRLAPGVTSAQTRTDIVASLVQELVADGLIPEAKVRHELQDVHPLAAGFVPPGGQPPSLRMERAAMIYFGIPSYGVHVNGWVRDPQNRDDPTPWAVWVARRSLSKATYAGLLDQMVAGGQPAGLSFEENVCKECEEEASLPPEIITQILPAGEVRYRYATLKGLSIKTLKTFDLEMPADLLPLCADGEVEEFRLMRVGEVLASLREELPLWKPNSALVVIGFCLRHGLVEPSEPGYEQLCRLLGARSVGAVAEGAGMFAERGLAADG